MELYLVCFPPTVHQGKGNRFIFFNQNNVVTHTDLKMFSLLFLNSWFPFVNCNICLLGILAESLLGTIVERKLDVWVAKYHVVCAVGFSVPLIFVNAWEVSS